MLKWRVGVRWYLAALLAYPGLFAATFGLSMLLGGTPTWYGGDYRKFHMPFWFLLVLNPPFVLCEEIGWRGYALPRLQRGRSALLASLILTVLWGLWHVPSFLMRDSIHYGRSFLVWFRWLLQFTIVMTWLYNNTGGSVPHTWFFHAATNYTAFLIPWGEALDFGDPLFLVTTLLIVILAGPARLSN